MGSSAKSFDSSEAPPKSRLSPASINLAAIGKNAAAIPAKSAAIIMSSKTGTTRIFAKRELNDTT